MKPDPFIVFLRVIAGICVTVFVVAAVALSIATCGGCAAPPEPEECPECFTCPPKRRCLFDSTGRVTVVLPDTCGSVR